MPGETSTPSARRDELLELAYRYVLEHGLADLTLRPLAAAVGSSPRVILFLFESKDGLVRALLARARVDELRLLRELRPPSADSAPSLGVLADRLWSWLAAEQRRALLTLWVEAYARSLVDPDGPWAGFARATVDDWLALLAVAQPDSGRGRAARTQRTLALAVLRGGLLDLLATDDADRVTAAVRQQLALLER